MYKNHRGNDIVIKELSDRDIVLLYKFFFKYSKSVEATLVLLEKPDTNFGRYVMNITSTRDALRSEVQIRKLKLSHYGP